MHTYSIQVPKLNRETRTKHVLLAMVWLLAHLALHPIEEVQKPNTMNLPKDHRELQPVLPRWDGPTEQKLRLEVDFVFILKNHWYLFQNRYFTINTIQR